MRPIGMNYAAPKHKGAQSQALARGDVNHFLSIKIKPAVTAMFVLAPKYLRTCSLPTWLVSEFARSGNLIKLQYKKWERRKREVTVRMNITLLWIPTYFGNFPVLMIVLLASSPWRPFGDWKHVITIGTSAVSPRTLHILTNNLSTHVHF